jgi:hypothetical protein
MGRKIICTDCKTENVTTVRPIAPHCGPRTPLCATHKRLRRQRIRKRAHELSVQKHYGITGTEYWSIYLAQDECCAICRRATGRAKRLAVDHDHKKCQNHPPEMGCHRCIRGLLCGPCNELIGRYGVESLLRAVEYLRNPPARGILNTPDRKVV